MGPSFVDKTEPGNSLSEVHMRNGFPQTKGVWVSLAYTRAFGTLGPKFKSWYAHHFTDAQSLSVPKLCDNQIEFSQISKEFGQYL